MIDTTFNFQAALGNPSLDADRYSAELQSYHQLLWNKPLPNGKLFKLEKSSQNRLYHKSQLGEFNLASDRAVNTYTRWAKCKGLMAQIPSGDKQNFRDITKTIGAIIIWPCNRVSAKPTINGMRGMSSKIADRLDLTIECIRRYYIGEPSPLHEAFTRYADFLHFLATLKVV